MTYATVIKATAFGCCTLFGHLFSYLGSVVGKSWQGGGEVANEGEKIGPRPSTTLTGEYRPALRTLK